MNWPTWLEYVKNLIHFPFQVLYFSTCFLITFSPWYTHSLSRYNTFCFYWPVNTHFTICSSLCVWWYPFDSKTSNSYWPFITTFLVLIPFIQVKENEMSNGEEDYLIFTWLFITHHLITDETEPHHSLLIGKNKGFNTIQDQNIPSKYKVNVHDSMSHTYRQTIHICKCHNIFSFMVAQEWKIDLFDECIYKSAWVSICINIQKQCQPSDYWDERWPPYKG